MTEDPEFEKKDFDDIVANLLRSKPLPKKQVKTSKKTKLRTVLPAPSDHRSKPEK
jgi:hypothetical protein